jgi:hypothetical protein
VGERTRLNQAPDGAKELATVGFRSPLPGLGSLADQSFAFFDLTPGVSYTITVNAVGAAGPGASGNPVSQIAV